MMRMKVISIILSIIVLWLTLTPCVDKLQDGTLQKTELAQQAHSDHQNDVDTCSPFCTCQCCQTTVHIPVVLGSTFIVVCIDNKYLNSNQDIANNYLFDFYTPPKA